MADLNEPVAPEYPDGIYQIETTDPVIGGPPNESTKAGLDNIPHLQLAKRTQWLKAAVDTLLARTISAAGLATGGGALNANRTITVPKASDAEARAGAIDTKALTPMSGRALFEAMIDASQVSANLNVTVGAGGDHPNINAALRALSEQVPLYVRGGITATITLLPGFVMAEQVLVAGVNLGWITITSPDPETTISRAALTTMFGVRYPAFGARDGGVLPIIDQLFRMNTSGTAANRAGLEVFQVGSAIVRAGAGIIAAPAEGAFVYESGTLSANGSVFTNNGGIGVAALGGARVALPNANLRDNAGGGISANNGATLQAEGVQLAGCGNFGISAQRGAIVNANSAQARIGASDGTNDLQVLLGGIIAANGAVGGANVAANTVSTNGTIYR